MKKLQLLRHAKSEHPLGISDIDRKLNQRGIKDTIKIGNFLKENISKPDLVLCSSSRRTKDTLKLIMQETNWELNTLYLDTLYLASAGEIMDILNQVNELKNSILLIAHNPGLTNLFNHLSFNRLDNLPTAGFAEFNDVKSWKKLGKNKLQNNLFKTPKLLAY